MTENQQFSALSLQLTSITNTEKKNNGIYFTPLSSKRFIQ